MKTQQNQPNKELKKMAAHRKNKKKANRAAPVVEAEPFSSEENEERSMTVEALPPSQEKPPAESSSDTSPVVENPSSMPHSGVQDTPTTSGPEEPIEAAEETETSPVADDEELELLTFFLAKEEYGIDIKMIQEITKLTNITPVPRTPPYIHGIVTLRGNVIPVFNIHDRLKLDPFVEGGKSRFVICQLKEGAAAITVDAVTDVVHLKKSRLEPPPSGVAVNGGGYIKNIGRYKERLLILLDLQKALQTDSSYQS